MANPRNKCKKKSWNDKWYAALVPIAWGVIRMSYGRDLQVDELINEAWLNSLRRLDKKADLGFVKACARGSMRQYVIGHVNRKNRVRFDNGMQSLYDDEGELIVKYMSAEKNRFSYDDVDDLKKCLNRYSFPIRSILLMKLQGWLQKDIAKAEGVTESAISLRLKQVGLQGVMKQNRDNRVM